MDTSPSLKIADRLVGLLLGGAVGDAFGAPVEFLRRAEILSKFGSRGVIAFAPAYAGPGSITDDTQMTLFTLEGLIRASVRYQIKGICHPPSVVDHAYRRWVMTQMEPFASSASDVAERTGWLIEQPELWSRRAPGHTCMSSLQVKGAQFGEFAENDSKGAGGIMRVGPVGLYCHDPFQMAADIARLTHGHVTSTVASGWFALWVAGIGRGQGIREAAEQAWRSCRGRAPELDKALDTAFQLVGKAPSDVVPSSLGEGWIAEEAGAIALWCVLSVDDPMEALRLAVNIDGDSDTTGSLVGQIFGAALGAGWIPADWLEQLELRDVIETLAGDAATSLEPDLDEAVWAHLAERYPGW